MELQSTICHYQYCCLLSLSSLVFILFLVFGQNYGEDDWGWESIDETIKMDVIPTKDMKELQNGFFRTYDFCITGEVIIGLYLVFFLV